MTATAATTHPPVPAVLRPRAPRPHSSPAPARNPRPDERGVSMCESTPPVGADAEVDDEKMALCVEIGSHKNSDFNTEVDYITVSDSFRALFCRRCFTYD